MYDNSQYDNAQCPEASTKVPGPNYMPSTRIWAQLHTSFAAAECRRHQPKSARITVCKILAIFARGKTNDERTT